MDSESPEGAPTNQIAILSLVAGMLTILSFCLAVVPMPLTGLVCFPSAAALGILAVAAGLLSLRQIRRTGQKGRRSALAGVWIGGPAAAASLGILSLGLALVPRIVDFIRGIGH
jgi:hypothetical protein